MMLNPQNLVVLPIIIPMFTAVLAVLFWKSRLAQRILGLLGSAAHLTAGVLLFHTVNRVGIIAVQGGNWPAPFGITIVADLLSATMVALAGLLGFLVTVYSFTTIEHERESFGYYPLLLFLIMGVSGAFLTGDMFNLYVWFEVMLISSFVLMALGGQRAQLEGAIKYVTLNLLSSALFLAAVGILYGTMGTLNMAHLALLIRSGHEPAMLTPLAILFLVAFGIKAAVFPLFFWLPASYHTPPVAVSTIFAALLSKVGVYSLMRVFTLLFVHDQGFFQPLFLIIAGFTMVAGVLGTIVQYEVRRLLSFHIVSQIGYMIMGLGFFTPLGLAGAIYFIIHQMFVKTNLFLISGLVRRLAGTYQLKELGGLYRTYPGVAALFLVSSLSLAGIPPLSGFWGKLNLVVAGLEVQQYAIVGVSLGVSILTLFSMMKIWAEAYWKPWPATGEAAAPLPSEPISMGSWVLYLFPILTLSILSLIMGLATEPFVTVVRRAAEQMLDPSEYIRVVLGVVL